MDYRYNSTPTYPNVTYEYEVPFVNLNNPNYVFGRDNYILKEGMFNPNGYNPNASPHGYGSPNGYQSSSPYGKYDGSSGKLERSKSTFFPGVNNSYGGYSNINEENRAALYPRSDTDRDSLPGSTMGVQNQYYPFNQQPYYPTMMPGSFMLPPINPVSNTQTFTSSPQKKKKNDLGLISDKMIESLEKQQDLLQQIAINMQGDQMDKIDKTRRAMMEKVKRLEYENMLRDQELLVARREQLEQYLKETKLRRVEAKLAAAKRKQEEQEAEEYRRRLLGNDQNRNLGLFQQDQSRRETDEAARKKAEEAKRKKQEEERKKKEKADQENQEKEKLKKDEEGKLFKLATKVLARKRIKAYMFTIAYPTLLKHYVNKFMDDRRTNVQRNLAEGYPQIEQAIQKFFLDNAKGVLDQIYKEKKSCHIVDNEDKTMFGKKVYSFIEAEKRISELIFTRLKALLDALISCSTSEKLPKPVVAFLASSCFDGALPPQEFLFDFEVKRLTFSQVGTLKGIKEPTSKMMICVIFMVRVLIYQFFLKPWTEVGVLKAVVSADKEVKKNLKTLGSVLYQLVMDIFRSNVSISLNNQRHLSGESKIRPRKEPLKIETSDEQSLKKDRDEIIDGVYTKEQLTHLFVEQKKYADQLKTFISAWMDRLYKVAKEEYDKPKPAK